MTPEASASQVARHVAFALAKCLLASHGFVQFADTDSNSEGFTYFKRSRGKTPIPYLGPNLQKQCAVSCRVLLPHRLQSMRL